jgi:biopolymer transport protein ExbD
MTRRSGRRRRQETAELNITAFMNLMVILVPFLLITAVFSRLAVLELNLPSASAETSELQEQQFHLEVTVRDQLITVGDRRSGVIKTFRSDEAGHDYHAVSDLLKELKARFPDQTEATLLLEPDVPYDVLVQVMDTVRVVVLPQEERMVRAELFPEISIGDAPVVGGGSK